VKTVFVDSGHLVALDSKADQHHGAASSHWRDFIRGRPRLVTTNLVMTEVVTFFSNRGMHARAVEIGNRLLASQVVRMIHLDEQLFAAGFEHLSNRPDKRFSMTDCVSFVVMERLGLREALAFDAHFEQAGFTRLPLTR
jgi:predicted nucleic acid-binding protein